MVNRLKLKPLVYLCLILALNLIGCSKEDQSAEEESVKQEITTEEVAAKIQQERTTESAPPTTQTYYERDYARAIKALDDEDYTSARELFTRAIKGHYKEQSRVKLYGMRFDHYLPHFYLGQVAFLSGDCHAAMEHWEISLAQEVIQETSEFPNLQQSLQKCKSESSD